MSDATNDRSNDAGKRNSPSSSAAARPASIAGAPLVWFAYGHAVRPAMAVREISPLSAAEFAALGGKEP
jgi:hypothetical protein